MKKKLNKKSPLSKSPLSKAFQEYMIAKRTMAKALAKIRKLV